MGEWRQTWRVVLTRGWGFPGPAQEVLNVRTVGELRDVVLHARADPTVERWTYWHAREWVGDDPAHDCGGSEGYAPVGISEHACRCGLYHRTYQCHRCGRHEWIPPAGPGCGPIPEDPDRPYQRRSG
jgi:hypothetical protein